MIIQNIFYYINYYFIKEDMKYIYFINLIMNNNFSNNSNINNTNTHNCKNIKNNTIKSLHDVEYFLNNFNKIKNIFNFYKKIKK